MFKLLIMLLSINYICLASNTTTNSTGNWTTSLGNSTYLPINITNLLSNITSNSTLNITSDITRDAPEDFRAIGNTLNISETTSYFEERSLPRFDPNQKLPLNFDLRHKHIITEVKDQGACGSCWAFASIAALESAFALRNNLTAGELIEFSEQQMVDCVVSPDYESKGCDGGRAREVFQYISRVGVVQESDYPYIDHEGPTLSRCLSKRDAWRTSLQDFYAIAYPTDQQMMEMIYNLGAIAVIINAGDNEFHNYKSGILTSVGIRDLQNSHSNHYITFVGWGTARGINYWIIKNSYGKSWGENGYFRMIRGINSRGSNSLALVPIAKQISKLTVTNNFHIETTPSHPVYIRDNDTGDSSVNINCIVVNLCMLLLNKLLN